MTQSSSRFSTAFRFSDPPSLAVPVRFFVTGPLALATVGLALVLNGATAVSSRWSPVTVGVTHLLTLGFLTMVTIGLLYPVLADLTDRPMPWRRSARFVYALFASGVASLCWGVATLSSHGVFLAIGLLAPAFVLFLGPSAVAVARVRNPDATQFGLGAALGCLFFAAAAGIWMAHGFSGMRFPGPRALWIQAHVSAALLGWLGGLLCALSWRVLPGFYGARAPGASFRWALQIVTAVSALIPVLLLLLDYFELLREHRDGLPEIAALSALPAIVCVWFLHPVACLWGLRRSRPRDSDASVRFWWGGLTMAPATGIAALVAYQLPSERWDLLFGWLALWGWSGMLVHGLLVRVVPLLVWARRFDPHAAQADALSERELVSEPRMRVGFALHLGSLLLGAAAIVSGSDALFRLTGLALLATSAQLGHSLLAVLRYRAR